MAHERSSHVLRETNDEDEHDPASGRDGSLELLLNYRIAPRYATRSCTLAGV